MKYSFELYVAGNNDNSKRSLGNLEKLVSRFSPETCQISVIDAMKDPAGAFGIHTFTTPTLVKTFPTLHKRVIDDLTQTEKVISVLDLKTPEFSKEVTT